MTFHQQILKRLHLSALVKKDQYLKLHLKHLQPLNILQHYWMILIIMLKNKIKEIKVFHSQQEDKIQKTHRLSKRIKIQVLEITILIQKKLWIVHTVDFQ